MEIDQSYYLQIQKKNLEMKSKKIFKFITLNRLFSVGKRGQKGIYLKQF